MKVEKRPFDVEPHNVEQEQQLLGAVIVDNDRFHKISGLVKAEHFWEPVHRDIWKAIASRVSNGHLADATTLANDFAAHEGIEQLGGVRYIVRLAGASISGFAVQDYAEDTVRLANARIFMDTLREAASKISENAPMDEVKAGVDLALMEVEEQGKENSIPLVAAFRRAIENMNEAYQDGAPVGIPTGLNALDQRTGGLFAPDLIVLAGRPSMGKTSLATSLGLRTAKAGKAVAIVSLEMDDQGLAQRILSELSGVPYFNYRRAHEMSERDFRSTVESANENSSLPIEIVPPHVRDPGAIFSALRKIDRKYKAVGGLGLVLVDYLQLVTERGNSANERIGKVSNGLKKIATMLHVPVIALSQLSRGVEFRDNKRPMLSDLRDSGQIEQDADVVLFCYRDHYYLSRETPPEDDVELALHNEALGACKNVMEVITAKQRFGSIGTDRIGCAIETNRFWNLEPSLGDRQEEITF
ncbi:replicative DNA helicase [Pelagimonas sp. KU-00592-HH]|uniref:DnaB-like helicase C-terminal domain-containing protein n=1 Tax=Pelagimonas sp. KU-00592-HH TaxID=3127651 RepID=UPI0031071391